MQKICEPESKCFGCGACAFVCPENAIDMCQDAEGFVRPEVDGSSCIDCGHCVLVCPAMQSLPSPEVSVYALRCRDPRLLSASSSGGAFSLIAARVIENGGLVCGAVFDETFRVEHVLSDDISGMRKSKYVQSDLTSCLPKIAQALSKGIPVLFSGTPCQCHAVKSCFPGEKDLWFAALICRGVMSPALWDEYRHYLEKEGPLSDFCFRDKRKDNDAHTVTYTVGGTEHAGVFMQDPFCRIYTRELSLRPSCYVCPYTAFEKPFDFTIGDFWGVEKTFPDLADGKGTSLVIAHGRRAEELIKDLRKEADIREVTKEQAAQPALRTPAKETLLRRFLFKDLGRKLPDGHCDIPLMLKKYG